MNPLKSKTKNQLINKTTFSVILAINLASCSSLSNPEKSIEHKPINVGGSYLEQSTTNNELEEGIISTSDEKTASFTRLTSNRDMLGATLEVDLSKRFDDKELFQVSANGLPFNDFLHYALGELLNVSYIIEPAVKSKNKPVTLELKKPVSAQRFFQLVQRVLAQNGTSVSLNEDVFYIYPTPKKGKKSERAFGFGRSEQDIPVVSGPITQLIPLKYKISKGLNRTLSSLLDANVVVDAQQNLVSISGNREQVLRSMSLIEMLDSPLLHNKSTALLSFAYIDTFTFIEKVTELLEQDGISTNLNVDSAASSVNFIPLEHLGKVVVFASADEILDRIEYWGKLIDQPATGSEQSYYVYHPRYARAADLGQSLAPLLVTSSNSYAFSSQGVGNNNGQTRPVNSNATGLANTGTGAVSRLATTGTRNAKLTQKTTEGDNLRMVVDERANALIFYSTGKHYQELQPIIRQLDIMPKQVMLEVVIAEVKLTGAFAKGVEFALKSGSSTVEKQSSFNFDSEGGFNYSIVGLPGSINVSLSQTDGLINVLSKPTLVVRDGVTASISVGDDIPTIGSTTSDPISGDRETTNIVYRKTGVGLNVTPTINAQGTVIMSIGQNISNVSASGPSIGGSQAVFERTISTEVVAGDGQTVMLGGLISETKNTGATAIPVLGSLPILGHLFRTDSEDSDKTELVVLVTPRIISNGTDWEMLKDGFSKGLENIKF